MKCLTDESTDVYAAHIASLVDYEGNGDEELLGDELAHVLNRIFKVCKGVERRLQPGTRLRYVVERCHSVTEDKWVRVLTTKFGYAMVNALESGVAYRFRVSALNIDGLESFPSPSVVATTLLETTPPPAVKESFGAVTHRSVEVNVWSLRRGCACARACVLTGHVVTIARHAPCALDGLSSTGARGKPLARAGRSVRSASTKWIG